MDWFERSAYGGGERREEHRGALLAVVEGAAELVANEEQVCDGAEGAERKIVLEMIAEACAGEHLARVKGAGLRLKAVAVTPRFEGATVLDVAEVLVPDELGDLRVPRKADG